VLYSAVNSLKAEESHVQKMHLPKLLQEAAQGHLQLLGLSKDVGDCNMSKGIAHKPEQEITCPYGRWWRNTTRLQTIFCVTARQWAASVV
jgi:hypothetical protein